MTNRCFFDVTDIKLYLRGHGTLSGIQRASLEVILGCVRQMGPEKVYLCVWDNRRRTYTAVTSDFMATRTVLDIDVLNAVLTGRRLRPSRAIPQILMRYRTRPVKYQFHRAIAHLQAWRGRESYFAKRGSSIAEWRKGPDPAPSPPLPDHGRLGIEGILEPGDQLVILGATWGMNEFDTYLAQLKDNLSIEISLLVHDLIPLVMPHHLVSALSLEFYRWLESSTAYCSRYFVATENTRRDLNRFLDELNIQRPITIIPFAQQMGGIETPDTYPTRKDELKALQHIPLTIRNKTKTPYVLVVGTLESRKNLWRLVQAWDRLTRDQNLEMPKLVFAGRQGWLNDDLMEWMRASGNLSGWVQFVNEPSDEELAYLYRHCLFTATVSLYEGWGLPIGESLSFGKTAVVANNSAMPEVGGDLVEYCDAGSIGSIAEACRRLIADPDRRIALEEKIAAKTLRSWQDVAADYIDALKTPPSEA